MEKGRYQSLISPTAGMFGFGVGFGEIGVGVLQHFVLIAVAQLAGQGAMLGAASGVGVLSVVFYCALADSFVRTSRLQIRSLDSPVPWS